MNSKRKAEATRWFRQAEYDLKAARWNIQGGFQVTACFLAQQTGKKALESFAKLATPTLVGPLPASVAQRHGRRCAASAGQSPQRTFLQCSSAAAGCLPRCASSCAPTLGG